MTSKRKCWKKTDWTKLKIHVKIVSDLTLKRPHFVTCFLSRCSSWLCWFLSSADTTGWPRNLSNSASSTMISLVNSEKTSKSRNTHKSPEIWCYAAGSEACVVLAFVAVAGRVLWSGTVGRWWWCTQVPPPQLLSSLFRHAFPPLPATHMYSIPTSLVNDWTTHAFQNFVWQDISLGAFYLNMLAVCDENVPDFDNPVLYPFESVLTSFGGGFQVRTILPGMKSSRLNGENVHHELCIILLTVNLIIYTLCANSK